MSTTADATFRLQIQALRARVNGIEKQIAGAKHMQDLLRQEEIRRALCPLCKGSGRS